MFIAIKWISRAWDRVKENTIKNCWKKSELYFGIDNEDPGDQRKQKKHLIISN